MGRVIRVNRRLQQLRNKLLWEHMFIHTKGASLPGVLGSTCTQLVLAGAQTHLKCLGSPFSPLPMLPVPLHQVTSTFSQVKSNFHPEKERNLVSL